MSSSLDVNMDDVISINVPKSIPSNSRLMPLSSSVCPLAPTTPSESESDIVIKKWNAVASWSYNVQNDTCAICRNSLMIPCITCQSNTMNQQKGEDCTTAGGVCNHVFHFHCISKWLNTRSTCPMDDQDWEFTKYS
ncbi:MAG: e3 ubiquitin-protein ligase rbx1 [Sylvanvirus sp.]|uniref:E3 ubiquitin-protein ligase rbx1 n=1 Tax=Sylvanvirus sp. TaxID=2487774 RepID=A0A3G5AIB6_9VIRU|nr:MAG: e3 ubiquitin-protein ligase rbx1 [Sylvanvirus sp.]